MMFRPGEGVQELFIRSFKGETLDKFLLDPPDGSCQAWPAPLFFRDVFLFDFSRPGPSSFSKWRSSLSNLLDKFLKHEARRNVKFHRKGLCSSKNS